jgi:hypothetical protein
MTINDFLDELDRIVNKYKQKYAKKPKKIALRIIKWCAASLFKSYGTPSLNESYSDTWIKIKTFSGRDITNDFPEYINNFKIPPIPHGGQAYFNIDKALEIKPNLKRLALVFFMGIGDYFYSTNFISLLKKTYPALSLDAYVSKNFDVNNSPLAGKCLEVNPDFENIRYYDGHMSKEYWQNYDYSSVYASVSKDTLVLPMIYEHTKTTKSRFEALCRTFNLPKQQIYPEPKVWTDYPASDNVINLLDQIKRTNKSDKPIIFVQMTSRSSNYMYPHTDELIKKLIFSGQYFIVTVEKTEILDDNYYYIDIKNTNINDTIKLLAALKEVYPVYCICIVSLFFAISSGLGITMLGLQHRYDDYIESVWFPNIYLIANAEYKNLPKSRVFEAAPSDYTYSKIQNIYTYTADFVFCCFDKITKKQRMNEYGLAAKQQ